MDNFYLNKRLGHIPWYLGCFPRDALPVETEKKFVLVFNTDIASGEGIHWGVIYSSRPEVAYYFDSFGKRPHHKEILQFLRRFKTVYYSTSKSQNIDASTCGHYCIFVVLELFNGQSFRSIVNYLKTISNDDQFVVDYVNLQNLF